MHRRFRLVGWHRGLFLWLVLLCMPAQALAAESARQYLAQHIAFELAATGGWRAGWADERDPGFHSAGGGAEINIGLELENGLGFLIGGRALFQRRFGQDLQSSGTYAEAIGQAIVQLRISDWVRIGLGATGGRLWRCCQAEAESPATSGLIFGGFLRVGLDVLPRNGLPPAFSLWLRLELDGLKPEDPMAVLPAVSMNLAVGLGLRL